MVTPRYLHGSRYTFYAVKEVFGWNWGGGGLEPLEHDHGQTDSRARAQRLSAAHYKVKWSILIGFIY